MLRLYYHLKQLIEKTVHLFDLSFVYFVIFQCISKFHCLFLIYHHERFLHITIKLSIPNVHLMYFSSVHILVTEQYVFYKYSHQYTNSY